MVLLSAGRLLMRSGNFQLLLIPLQRERRATATRYRNVESFFPCKTVCILSTLTYVRFVCFPFARPTSLISLRNLISICASSRRAITLFCCYLIIFMACSFGDLLPFSLSELRSHRRKIRMEYLSKETLKLETREGFVGKLLEISIFV